MKTITLNLKTTLKWLLLSLATALFCGVAGAGFLRLLHLVTNLRHSFSHLVFLLPVAGVITVYLYLALNVKGIGTISVINTAKGNSTLTPKIVPAIFLSSVLTHLCGGSAGKEGAALQIGGGISALLAKVFKLNDTQQKALTVCGMGALFSAVFCTPFGAAVFAVEVIGITLKSAYLLIPTVISSVGAYAVSTLLGSHADSFFVSMPTLNIIVVLKSALIGIVCAAVAFLFCKSLHVAEKLFRKIFKNDYIKIAVLGGVIIALTLAVGSMRYNGGGMEIVEKIFNSNEYLPYDFLLKILFTVITVSAGFKGGEIVPTLFIGATLGALLGQLLGVGIALGAAVGMFCHFCAATKCPISSVILSAEIFGVGLLPITAPATIISYLLSSKTGLYTSEE